MHIPTGWRPVPSHEQATGPGFAGVRACLFRYSTGELGVVYRMPGHKPDPICWLALESDQPAEEQTQASEPEEDEAWEEDQVTHLQDGLREMLAYLTERSDHLGDAAYEAFVDKAAGLVGRAIKFALAAERHRCARIVKRAQCGQRGEVLTSLGSVLQKIRHPQDRNA